MILLRSLMRSKPDFRVSHMNFNRIAALLGTLMMVTSSRAQILRYPQNASRPCHGSAVIDAVEPPTLDSLVMASKLIIVGTVVRVLPAVVADPTHPRSHIETHSLISVDQLLHGALPEHTKTIAITQIGGEVPPCKLV